MLKHPKRVNTGSHCCSKEGVAAANRARFKTTRTSLNTTSKFRQGGKGGARPKKVRL